MKSQVLRFLIFVVLLSGTYHTFAVVSTDTPFADQQRICTYKGWTYEVNTIKSDESFLLSSWERNEIINQVIKRWGSLYFAVLSFPYVWDIEFTRYKYQPAVSLYKFKCETNESEVLISVGYGYSDSLLNGAILNAEIDMIDAWFLVTKAYDTSNKTNNHLYYDLTAKKQFFMDYTTETTSQFNSILDYKPGKNGIGKVLVRLSNMRIKWMNYDFHKKIIY